MHGPEPSPASTRPFSGPRGAEQAELRNALYAKEWSRFRGFFCPAMKPLRTAEAGSRKKRVSDKPLTPFERLKSCAQADAGEIANGKTALFPSPSGLLPAGRFHAKPQPSQVSSVRSQRICP